MGINAQDIIAQDPDMLRKQLYQREMQQLNPSGDVFGTIGALLGRGVANKSQGRGFFDVADPALRRVAKMNEYQQEAMQIGGGDTVKTLEALKSRLIQDRELAPFAVKVDEELTKARKGIFETERATKADARSERSLQIQESQAMEAKYKNNPELLLEDALKLPDDDPKKNAMLTRYSRITEERNYSIADKEADLAQARANLIKTQAETARIRLITQSEERDSRGKLVNNNGVPVGTFDKVGRYKAPDGTVYSAKAVEEARAGHDSANDLIFKLDRLTKDDIKNAYGSAVDYTTTPGGALIAGKKTYGAQTKINEVGIRSVLNNLSQLKGPSSDKEMAQMIKDFPGYQAKPEVMEAWVERAVETTNRFLKRSEKRFGLDTDYGVEGRFKKDRNAKTEPEKKPQGTWRIVE
jgi:hypothetical protein